MEKVIVGGGDLAELDAPQRAEYYAAVCRALGLNPLTKPFEYLTLNGKLRLYALRDCADQLRRLHGISIYIANREKMSDIYVVTARAKDKTGREDESTGAVPLGNLRGDALANALMKAETKAKRRVTLSIAGLGWLDETELETVKGAVAVPAEGMAPVATVQDASLEEAPTEPAEVTAHLDGLRQERQQAAAPGPKTRPVAKTPPPDGAVVLAPELKEVIKTIVARVIALYPGEVKQDKTVGEDRRNVLHAVFGVEVESGLPGLETLAALGLDALRAGLAKLERMERQAPDDADVPDHPPPHPDVTATAELVASLRRRAGNLGLTERFDAWLKAGAGEAMDEQGRLLLSATERGQLNTAFNDFLTRENKAKGSRKKAASA
jgi:hypothetical protein